MYSREDRIKAIELWLKYEKRTATVIRELGYPSRRLLPLWDKDYLQEQETGIVHDRYRKKPKYTTTQREYAVGYYLEHGRCLAQTIRAIGYPSRELLSQWCAERSPSQRKCSKFAVQFTQEQKQNAVIALCSRRTSAKQIADEHGVTRAAIYKWKNKLLGKGSTVVKPKKRHPNLPQEREQLISEIESLQEQVQKLRMEKDILEAAAELIKKDPGVDLRNLSNREKMMLVDALKYEYPQKALLKSLGLPRSTFYYQYEAAKREGKHEQLKNHMAELFVENNCCYGYRRMHLELAREGRKISEKVVKRLMSEANLIVVSKRKRKYSSYQGEITPAPENLLKRDFHADTPNEKWLTDITEFHIPAGKVYLSPIVDCFDGLLISWTISTRPDAAMVNAMLDLAIRTLDEGECPIIHSDRGSHYRWPGWLERVENSGLIRSMSKKGCSPDNAACEGLFGRIKNEMFYNRSWAGVSMDAFMETLDKYLYWYNNKRIKVSLGGMSPLNYRLSLGLSA